MVKHFLRFLTILFPFFTAAMSKALKASSYKIRCTIAYWIGLVVVFIPTKTFLIFFKHTNNSSKVPLWKYCNKKSYSGEFPLVEVEYSLNIIQDVLVTFLYSGFSKEIGGTTLSLTGPFVGERIYTSELCPFKVHLAQHVCILMEIILTAKFTSYFGAQSHFLFFFFSLFFARSAHIFCANPFIFHFSKPKCNNPP